MATKRNAKKTFDDLLPHADGGGTSRPNTTNDSKGRRRREDAGGHPEGPYGDGSDSFGNYNNFANAAHMLCRLVRLSSGSRPHTVDWQLNLRGGAGRKPEEGWRRYFTRKPALMRLLETAPQRMRPTREDLELPLITASIEI